MATQRLRQILKFRKTIVGLAVLCVFVAFGYSNCVPASSGYLGNEASTGSLQLYPATVTIPPGAVQPFMAGGGQSPYTYQIIYGAGTVSAAGVYTAPAYTGSATLEAMDSAGNTAIASITIQTSTTTGGLTYYQCPAIPSNSCGSISSCESTCIGQLSPNSSCTYYNGGSPTTSPCTQVTTPPAVYYCNVQYSFNNCTSASSCQSTCMGQYQTGTTCSYYAGTTQELAACPTTVGLGAVAVYSCPVMMSQGESNTSFYQSECVGQYSFLSSCNYYNSSGSAIPVACTFIGNETY